MILCKIIKFIYITASLTGQRNMQLDFYRLFPIMAANNFLRSIGQLIHIPESFLQQLFPFLIHRNHIKGMIFIPRNPCGKDRNHICPVSNQKLTAAIGQAMIHDTVIGNTLFNLPYLLIKFIIRFRNNLCHLFCPSSVVKC